MSLKTEIICNICKMILNNPISLPCYCVVCDIHLKDNSVKNGWIKCLNVIKVFEIAKNEFKPNKMIKNILKKELHLSDEEKTLKNLNSRFDRSIGTASE
jgi:hypothetical protein